MSAPGRLSLADVEDGCYFTNDDLVTLVLEHVEEQMQITGRVERLLTGDAGRTIEDIAEILDIDVFDAATALAHLAQAGAIFETVEVATGELGYRLIDWVA